MTKVINFFAGPGAGKSTAAAGLFYAMKCRGLNVELVTEYAKDLFYMGKLGCSFAGSAWSMASVQYERQRRLVGKVDYVVTDSPLLKDLAYAHYSVAPEAMPEFEALVRDRAAEFDNYNVWVNRVKPYQPRGRRESEASARAVDRKLWEQFSSVLDIHVDGDVTSTGDVLKALGLWDADA